MKLTIVKELSVPYVIRENTMKENISMLSVCRVNPASSRYELK